MAPDPKLRLRLATIADSRSVWEWRNDPVTRKYSMRTGRVPWRKHQQWFSRHLRDPRHRIYVAVRGGVKVGVLRHDRTEPRVVEVSIHVNPEFRNQGLGRRILKMSNVLLDRKHPRDFQKAMIRSENKASAKIFFSAGFIKLHEMEDPPRAVWIRRA